jgi:hypothetical protein
VAGRQWFGRGDIERGGRYLAAFQGRKQSVVIEHFAAADVDDVQSGFGGSECFCVHGAAGCLGERNRKNQMVHDRNHLLQRPEEANLAGVFRRSALDRVDCHAEGFELLRDAAADRAIAIVTRGASKTQAGKASIPAKPICTHRKLNGQPCGLSLKVKRMSASCGTCQAFGASLISST